MLRRFKHKHVAAALGDTPVVLVQGARQTGKTTLVEAISAEATPARAYVTLDSATVLAAAKSDPEGFVRGLPETVALDEIQHAPELFPAIKRAVDQDRRPGRFLLTGSANVLLLPKLSESLAGRMEVISLWPLSQGERDETDPCGLVDALFSEGPLPHRPCPDVAELHERMLAGGYPEALTREAQRRQDWFDAYVTTILQRDVRDLSNIEGLTTLPRLMTLLATRIGGLLNVADIGRSLSLPYTTLTRYMSLLEALFLLHPLPAWSTNLGKRLVKSPKLFFVDTGLAAALIGCDEARLAREPTLRGALFEHFVVSELAKQATWSTTRPHLFHFRTTAGEEVDIVLERRSGEIVGVEVKASTTVSADDFRGLRALQKIAGSRFTRGVVLHTGNEALAFGDGLEALPMGSLW